MNIEFNEILRKPVQDGVGFLEWRKRIDEFKATVTTTEQTFEYLLYMVLKNEWEKDAERIQLRNKVKELNKVIHDIQNAKAKNTQIKQDTYKKQWKQKEAILLSNIKGLCQRLGIEFKPYTQV